MNLSSESHLFLTGTLLPPYFYTRFHACRVFPVNQYPARHLPLPTGRAGPLGGLMAFPMNLPVILTLCGVLIDAYVVPTASVVPGPVLPPARDQSRL
jgi:hypothetical protein